MWKYFIYYLTELTFFLVNHVISKQVYISTIKGPDLATDHINYGSIICNKTWNVIGSVPNLAHYPRIFHGIRAESAEYQVDVSCAGNQMLKAGYEWCRIRVGCRRLQSNNTDFNEFTVMGSNNISAFRFYIDNVDDGGPSQLTSKCLNDSKLVRWKADIGSLNDNIWYIIGWTHYKFDYIHDISVVIFASPRIMDYMDVDAQALVAYTKATNDFQIRFSNTSLKSSLTVNRFDQDNHCVIARPTLEQCEDDGKNGTHETLLNPDIKEDLVKFTLIVVVIVVFFIIFLMVLKT